MKRFSTLIVLGVLAALGAMSCNKSDDDSLYFNKELELNEGEAADITHGFKVSVVALSDSRCPKGIFCARIGPGIAEARLLIEMDGDSYPITINHLDMREVIVEGHLITFIELSPFPDLEAGNMDDTKSIKFRIEGFN